MPDDRLPTDRSDVNSEEQANPSAQKASSLSMVEQHQLNQFLVDRLCKLCEGDLAIRAQSHHSTFESLALYTKNSVTEEQTQMTRKPAESPEAFPLMGIQQSVGYLPCSTISPTKTLENPAMIWVTGWETWYPKVCCITYIKN